MKHFLTWYDDRFGVERFDEASRCALYAVGKLLGIFLYQILSARCFHQWGGAKMMLREVCSFLKPGDFVYKTDVYSYYASMNHGILMQQLYDLGFPKRFMETMYGYLQRTMLRMGDPLQCTMGIPKGGALSPALGALYLTPLDHAMERWMAREDCFYARFQDDIIIIARKRHVMRAMRREMYEILSQLRLGLRPEKTFVGRVREDTDGFDLLGYTITLKGLYPNETCIQNAREKARQRYAQGGQKSLLAYIKRWEKWAPSGLKKF